MACVESVTFITFGNNICLAPQKKEFSKKNHPKLATLM